MIDSLRNIRIEDFDYPLTPSQIAQYPKEERDRSKLLLVNRKSISEDTFCHLASWLPADSLLISNETRVIHARLLFHKASGSRIEIFCLEPAGTVSDIQLAYQQQQSCIWKCLVGNARRWKSGALAIQGEIDGSQVNLEAKVIEKNETGFHIQFSWTPVYLTFAQVLEHFGKIPLPPYISREASETDATRYQTVFARNNGSVAAPTAGLHFTEEVLKSLEEKHIRTLSVTLHVGAGTFKPVSSETIGEHHMHSEQVIVPVKLIKEILSSKNKHITLVGTTTVRTLESVYWQGVKWLKKKPKVPVMHIEQWDPYIFNNDKPVATSDALQCVVDELGEAGLEELHGETALMIAPGYNYRIPDAIITNFHQPRSTLLLLVAAFAGEQWKAAYRYALEHDFRFLSYGDSCLFMKESETGWR